jgi:hypothetical protein
MKLADYFSLFLRKGAKKSLDSGILFPEALHKNLKSVSHLATGLEFLKTTLILWATEL